MKKTVLIATLLALSACGIVHSDGKGHITDVETITIGGFGYAVTTK
jgi:hypothetical protein